MFNFDRVYCCRRWRTTYPRSTGICVRVLPPHHAQSLRSHTNDTRAERITSSGKLRRSIIAYAQSLTCANFQCARKMVDAHGLLQMKMHGLSPESDITCSLRYFIEKFEASCTLIHTVNRALFAHTLPSFRQLGLYFRSHLLILTDSLAIYCHHIFLLQGFANGSQCSRIVLYANSTVACVPNS